MSFDASSTPPDMVPAPGSALTLHLEVPSLKSLYIEMYFGDTLLSSGTAFLVANDQSSHCALITNRHNVTGRHQETGNVWTESTAPLQTISASISTNPLWTLENGIASSCLFIKKTGRRGGLNTRGSANRLMWLP